jgi:hypothetical protein
VVGEQIFEVVNGVIAEYCYSDDLGRVAVGDRRLRFRGVNASAGMNLTIGASVRCWVLRSGFVQRLERRE